MTAPYCEGRDPDLACPTCNAPPRAIYFPAQAVVRATMDKLMRGPKGLPSIPLRKNT